MKEKSRLKLLANGRFLRIWLAQIFSLVSATTLSFILIGRIYQTTLSTVAVSFYLFFYYLPTAVLGPFAGVFIDNWNKRKILIFSSLFQAGLVLFFWGISQKVWPVYSFILLYSLADEFFNPSIGASLPSLVQKESLSDANSLFLFTTQGALVAGSFAGGLMLKFLKPVDWAFVVLSLFLLVATFLVYGLPIQPLRGSKKLKKGFKLTQFWQQAHEGYLFIKNEPRVLFPILLLTGFNILAGIGAILLPSLAQMLEIEFADSSYLVVLPAVLGAGVGSWLIGKNSVHTRKNVFILRGLGLASGGLLALAVISWLPARPIFWGAPLISLLGLGSILVYVPLQTLLQEHTPFDVRGRVFGVLSTLVTLAVALPVLLTTTLVDIFGIRLVLASLGFALFSLTLVARQNKEKILTFNQLKK